LSKKSKSKFPNISKPQIMSTPIKSAFPPMRATASPEKPTAVNSLNDIANEVQLEVAFWLEITDRPQKEPPFWAYVGNPKETDSFGRRIVAVLNVSYWPAAAAVEHKDWRAIRWMASLAILERCALQYHPVLSAVRFRLCQLASCQPKAHNWETILWAVYRLKDTSFVAGLDSVPLTVGTLEKFAQLAVRVDAGKLEEWESRARTKQREKAARG
jgi:hypothetical protein